MIFKASVELGDNGASIAQEVGSLIAPVLGWSASDQKKSVNLYLDQISREVAALKATTNYKSVEVTVEVIRATGTPVVTGTVVFRSDSELAKKPVQTVVRDAAGVWVLSIDGLSAGSYTGKIVYVDQTGTHSQSEQIIQFILEEGIAPSPKPSATKKPVTPTTDGCKNQIKN